jgi:SAM-dependent methyltransferase
LIRSTAFSGTANDYARYRPPYPEAFLCQLRSDAATRGTGTLLDLACGPGRIAIPMAPFFSRVLAVDIEAEMIATGKHEAGARGIGNIVWRVERAEDLRIRPHSIELVTVGEAFHRLDQIRVLARVVNWLEPHGALATLGAEPLWRGEEPWKRLLVEVVNRWTGQALGEPNNSAWGGPGDALREAGLEVDEHEHAVDWVWPSDSIVGFMFSTSIASRRVLGDKADRFEADLRRVLLDCEPNDRFVCTQRFGFTLGRKTGGAR